MRKFKCYDCDEVFESETSEEMLNLLHPHYMEKHKDIIEKSSETEKKEWMKRFSADWEAAKEN